jgi:NitT/TauT family transport system substrate-binding protein
MRLGPVLAFCLACGGAQAADVVRVGYAAQSFAFTGAVEMGLQQGFFAEEGLDVQPTMYGGGAKLHQAMIAGSEDVGMAAASDFSLLVKGAPERAVYGVVNEPFSVGVSAVDPAIRAPDDLKGRRLGVTTQGSYTYWFASQLPHFLHWKPGEAAVPVSIGGTLAAQMAAVTTGQVDAAVGDIVLGLMLQHEGRGRIVLNASEVVKYVVTSLVFAHHDMMAEHPEVLRRYLAGLRQSIDFLVSHKDATVKLAVRLNGLPEPVIAQYIDITNPGWSRDGRISAAQLQGTAEAIAQAGLLPSVPDLTPYYTEAYFPK